MPVLVHSGLTDDNDFVSLIHSILECEIARHQPELVWVVQIDNWFDHKWLRFSGYGTFANKLYEKSMPGDNFSIMFDSVKEPFFQAKLTVPPFTPERILGQWSFQKSNGHFVEIAAPRVPHRSTKTHSAENLYRRIENYSQSALFAWYSGNTIRNDRGSLMVYRVNGREVDCWYASFRKNPTWGVSMTKGIDRELISKALPPG